MPRESYAFQVRGIEPRDPAFRLADDAAKQAFWQAAVKWVEAAMDAQLAAGKDRRGHDLVPISEATRQKGRWRSHTGMGDPDAPPLTPAYALSRTRKLFDARAHWREGYILGFWRFDSVTGRHWGQILGWHRAGKGRLPERDVIGLSPASVAAVRAKADQWWRDWQSGHAHAQRAQQATIKLPPPSGRPIPTRPTPTRVVAGARFDIEHFTFGIGGSKSQVEQSIAAGTFTGFRKPPPFKPGGGTAAKAPPRPIPARTQPFRPQPIPVPIPKRPAAVARTAMPAAEQPTPYVPVPPLKIEKSAAPKRVPLDLATFAERARTAADTVGPEGRFGAKKVFISHAHEAYVRMHGPIHLADFKNLLARAAQARHVDLTRADLVQAMKALDVEASLTWHPAGGAEWHFIRTEH